MWWFKIEEVSSYNKPRETLLGNRAEPILKATSSPYNTKRKLTTTKKQKNNPTCVQ